MNNLILKLYPQRFLLLLIILLLILFGSLVFPRNWFEDLISPILLIINLMAGIILTYKKPRLMRFLIGLVALNVLILFSDTVNYNLGINIKVVKLVSYFIFYGIVTFEIIQQVANARMVEKNVIIGLICGYLALGLLSFFLFFVIELVEPNSFSSIVFQEVGDNELPTQRLLYFSFVTLLTIGYGEVVPVSEIAQKAAILVALIGQFYIVILMAIVVGKYINQFQHDS